MKVPKIRAKISMMMIKVINNMSPNYLTSNNTYLYYRSFTELLTNKWYKKAQTFTDSLLKARCKEVSRCRCLFSNRTDRHFARLITDK